MKIKQTTKTRASRKPYTTPRLTRYGDLKALTGGGRRTGKDPNVVAASPKTRVPTSAL